MDFARKQLEKYGWTDGKGLGKHENGISQALKPKLKRSVTGIGYDAAADFTEHWWSALYDKAASNVEVEEKNGKTKKMKRKDDKEFEITNSTWKLKHNTDNNNEEYSEFFVKTAVLDGGSSTTTKVKDTDSESEREDGKDVAKMTDEQLFAACQGRTAHKGARHGLRALGKLARIEQQEQLLLQQAKYNSFTKKTKKSADLQVVEDASLNDEVVEKKKKRKKKKRCNSNENEFNGVNTSSNELSIDLDNIETNENSTKKSKKSKNQEIISEEDIKDHDNSTQENKIKKKKRKHKEEQTKALCAEEGAISHETLNEPEIQECNFIKKKKKKKNKDL